MGKILKASAQELDAIFALTTAIPDSEVKNGRKHSNFRRAIKLALKKYNDGVESFLSVFREDAKKFQEDRKSIEAALVKAEKGDKKKLEKKVESINKALEDIDVQYQEKLKEYQEEHKESYEVNFNEEDFNYILNSISDNSSTLFRLTGTGKDGKEISAYDSNRADAFFELLDKAI